MESDPTWPRSFEVERRALAEALRALVVDGIHHVGSTSVPGLSAKPIIDILVGVESLERARPVITLVAPLGYGYFPYRANDMHWFCKPDHGHRTHHLHLDPARSDQFQSELAFRDYLRAHPATSTAYANLKHVLAARFTEDREAYTAAKAPFTHEVLRLARSQA